MSIYLGSELMRIELRSNLSVENIICRAFEYYVDIILSSSHHLIYIKSTQTYKLFLFAVTQFDVTVFMSQPNTWCVHRTVYIVHYTRTLVSYVNVWLLLCMRMSWLMIGYVMCSIVTFTIHICNWKSYENWMKNAKFTWYSSTADVFFAISWWKHSRELSGKSNVNSTPKTICDSRINEKQ